jgi:uncharacterized metal-binding protein
MDKKSNSDYANSIDNRFETIKIEKTKNACSLCEDFADAKIKEQVPYAILSCEGACLRGEVSRQTANLICYSLMPDKASRICLGGAFTKDSGQRNLVRNAQRIIALEGCFIECASRMMKGVIDDLKPEVIIVDRLYDFDRNLFGLNEVTEQQIKEYAQTAANKIVEKIKHEDK